MRSWQSGLEGVVGSRSTRGLIVIGLLLGSSGAWGEEPREDPAASKLLAQARAARAVWEQFPGFRANVEVNLEGQVSRGQVRVEPGGKVHLQGLEAQAQRWAQEQLTQLVGHRLPESKTALAACAFTDQNTDHPLGREVCVLGDPLHSRYRIREGQIRVVSRQLKGQQFTITVLKQLQNPKGKYLPASYVVDYWDLKTGHLVRSEAVHQTWVRVGGYDLPRATLVVSVGPLSVPAAEGPAPASTARLLLLTKHKLLTRGAAGNAAP